MGSNKQPFNYGDFFKNVNVTIAALIKYEVQIGVKQNTSVVLTAARDMAVQAVGGSTGYSEWSVPVSLMAT